MISARNLVVNGGTFTFQAAGNGRKASFDILKDAVAHSAFHNSEERFDPPKCHPNTRVVVLEKIMNWVRRSDIQTKDRFIMWLTGAAGAGKSAIAQSFTELCLIDDLVLASFFFGRSDDSRNHGKAFVASLVYQIYHAIPAAQADILSVIDADPLILTRSLDHQFTRLVSLPLRGVYSSDTAWPSESYRVIVIDGLDECLNRETQQEILRIIFNAVQEFHLPMIYLIASRPEHDISVVFRSHLTDDIYTRLYLDDTYRPSEDIRTFLQDSFQKIRTTHPFKEVLPTPTWPAADAVEILVKRSSGQFIYAATVVRYVQSMRHHPHERLNSILKLRPAQGDLPFNELDAMYTMILSSAQDTERVLYALSIYVLGVVRDKDLYFNMSEFMSLGQGELALLFCDLGSIVSVTQITTRLEKKQETIRILHASLHDFLLDPIRSKDYFLDIDKYRPRHLSNIIRYLTLDYILIEFRALSVTEFSEKNFPLCQSSTDLMEVASSFHIDRVLASLPIDRVLEEVTEDILLSMSRFIFYMWLPFLRRMGCLHQEWALTEQQQGKALDRFFQSNVSAYYESHYSTAFLYHACYAGTDALVPRSDISFAPRMKAVKADRLWLSVVKQNKIGTDKDVYRQHLLQFIQHPTGSNQSGAYDSKEDAYSKVTAYFLNELSRNLHSRHRFKSYESDVLRQLIFHEGMWTLNIPDDQNKKRDFHINAEINTETVFLFLGYLIFFLPRSGRSKKLEGLAQAFLPRLNSHICNTFPERTKLLRQELNNYLERVAGCKNGSTLDDLVNNSPGLGYG